MYIEVDIKTYKKKLGKAVFDARKKLKCSREDLAKEIEQYVIKNGLSGYKDKKKKGISYKTIERIEKANYKNDLTFSTIETICQFLGISIKLTLGGS